MIAGSAAVIIVVVTAYMYTTRPSVYHYIINNQSDTPAMDEVKEESPQTTIKLFMDNFIALAPPEVDVKARETAYLMLSDGARDNLVPNPEDLPSFVGIQDMPDKGYEITDVIVKDNLAEVTVTLKYSGGNIVRIFRLSEVQGEWKIDSIEIE